MKFKSDGTLAVMAQCIEAKMRVLCKHIFQCTMKFGGHFLFLTDLLLKLQVGVKSGMN